MPVKSIAVALLVPPISLGLFALAGLLIQRRHRRLGHFATWSGLLVLLLLAIPAVGSSLLVALEQDLPLKAPDDAPPQAIVILGGDSQRGPGDKPTWLVGALSLERVRAGAMLHRRTGLPILVSGGALHAGEPPVAELMADSLISDFQVPVQWIEPVSRDSWEDAHFSADILHKQGLRSVYVVTQAWHMRRALMAFASAGIIGVAAPTQLDAVRASFVDDFVPTAGGWQASYFAFHEWIGCAWYALR